MYDDNPLNHLKRAKNFFNQYHQRKELKIRPKKNQKIRIGYFSADFHGNHPLMSLFPSIVTSHDNLKFEVYIYSFTTKEDEYTEKLKESVDFFKNIKRYYLRLAQNDT